MEITIGFPRASCLSTPTINKMKKQTKNENSNAKLSRTEKLDSYVSNEAIVLLKDKIADLLLTRGNYLLDENIAEKLNVSVAQVTRILEANMGVLFYRRVDDGGNFTGWSHAKTVIESRNGFIEALLTYISAHRGVCDAGESFINELKKAKGRHYMNTNGLALIENPAYKHVLWEPVQTACNDGYNAIFEESFVEAFV